MMTAKEIATATLDQLNDELAAAGFPSNETDIDEARKAVADVIAPFSDANKIHDALEAWEAVGHLPFSEAMNQKERLVDAVTSAIKRMDGVENVYVAIGSAGSTYWTIFVVDGDYSVGVRVSNHKAGKRACENDADIVVGDSVKEIERQLAKIEESIKASQEMAMA